MKTLPNYQPVPADAATRDRSGKRRTTRCVVDLAADVRTLTQDGENLLAERDQALRVLAATLAALRAGWTSPDLYAVALLTRHGLMPAPGADPHEVLAGLARPTVADLARLYPEDQDPDTGGLRRTIPLEVSPHSPGRARRFAVHAVADWCLPGLADDAQTIISELVTNVVRHAASRAVFVALALDAAATKLVIEVGDEDPRRPRLHSLPATAAVGDPGTADGEGGAGLYIVRALAHQVDVLAAAPGKVVAATLLLGGAR